MNFDSSEGVCACSRSGPRQPPGHESYHFRGRYGGHPLGSITSIVDELSLSWLICVSVYHYRLSRGRSMKEPLSDAVACTACGASVTDSSRPCWLCGERLPMPAARDAEDQSSPVLKLPPPVPGVSRAPLQFTLASLMLGVTLIAVALGLFGLEPGLGIGFAFLALPAAIRASSVARRRSQSRGTALTWGEKIGLVCTSLLVVLCIGVAAYAAFFALCLAGFFGGAAVAQAVGERGQYAGLSAGIIVGGLCGIIGAIAAGAFVARWLWKGS